MTLVRKDEKGLYVRAGGYVARPGPVRGYAHAFDMSDGSLQAGDYVKAHHRCGTPLTFIKTNNDTQLVWIHDGYPEELK